MKTIKRFSSKNTEVGDRFAVRDIFLSGIDAFGVDAERKVILACMEGKSHKEDYPVSFRDSDTVTITKKPWRPRDGSIWVGFKLNNEGSEYEAFWETLKCAVVKIIEE